MTILTCIAKKSFLAAAAMAKPGIYLAFPILFASHAPPVGASEKTAAHASIRAADAGRHIAALANDSFEGREGGSRGGRAAGTYIVGVIERLGLQPAGDAGTYYQRFGPGVTQGWPMN
ncbi:MAG: hypothetical protein NTY25_11945 [Planctomycetia bacterium]|nr:hypothetical protein [Planctomycetia bacterium]